MQSNTLARWLGAFALVAAPAMAQQIPVERFRQVRRLDEVALSPTGEYLAIAVPYAGRQGNQPADRAPGRRHDGQDAALRPELARDGRDLDRRRPDHRAARQALPARAVQEQPRRTDVDQHDRRQAAHAVRLRPGRRHAARPQQGHGLGVHGRPARQGAGQGAREVLLLALECGEDGDTVVLQGRHAHRLAPGNRTHQGRRRRQFADLRPRRHRPRGVLRRPRTARRRCSYRPTPTSRLDAAAQGDRRLRDRRWLHRRRQQHAVRARLRRPGGHGAVQDRPRCRYAHEGRGPRRRQRRHAHDRRPQGRALRRDLHHAGPGGAVLRSEHRVGEVARRR